MLMRFVIELSEQQQDRAANDTLPGSDQECLVLGAKRAVRAVTDTTKDQIVLLEQLPGRKENFRFLARKLDHVLPGNSLELHKTTKTGPHDVTR